MAVPTFSQNSRLGQRFYQIREGVLFISVPKPGGGFVEHRVDLRRLNPNYKPSITRSWALLVIPSVIFVGSAIVLWGLWHQTTIPDGAVDFFYHWPLLVAVTSLVAAIRGTRRIEFYRFSDHWGRPIVDIIRERNQADDCSAFMIALVAHIETAQSDLPPDEKSRLLQEFERESSPAIRAEVTLARWKLALVFGVLAAGIPLVPGASLEADPSMIILILPLCICGAVASWFSFEARETKRWWSLIGAVLSLLPPFVY